MSCEKHIPPLLCHCLHNFCISAQTWDIWGKKGWLLTVYAGLNYIPQWEWEATPKCFMFQKLDCGLMGLTQNKTYTDGAEVFIKMSRGKLFHVDFDVTPWMCTWYSTLKCSCNLRSITIASVLRRVSWSPIDSSSNVKSSKWKELMDGKGQDCKRSEQCNMDC